MWFRKSYALKSPLLEEADLTVSFCISHKDRLSYLQQTLEENLKANRQNQVRTEFILVDFSKSTKTRDWVRSQFKPELQADYLRCYHSDQLEDWHASVAKNTTHALASGQLLVNLDCDNFTGERGADFVVNHFTRAAENILLWQYSKKKLDGTYGRISMTKDTFEQLGGYNESFLPMGFQDGDLIDRAKKIGVKVVRDANPAYNQAIKHEKFKPKDISWKRMNEHNERLSKQLIREGKLVANQGNCRGLSTNVERIQ